MGSTTPGLWGPLLSSVAVLMGVLGLLVIVLMIIKRLASSHGGISNRGLIKTLATHYVSPKQRLVLIDVLGERILIGVSQQRIDSIARIDSDEPVETFSPQEAGLFSSILNRAKDPKNNQLDDKDTQDVLIKEKK